MSGLNINGREKSILLKKEMVSDEGWKALCNVVNVNQLEHDSMIINFDLSDVDFVGDEYDDRVVKIDNTECFLREKYTSEEWEKICALHSVNSIKNCWFGIKDGKVVTETYTDDISEQEADKTFKGLIKAIDKYNKLYGYMFIKDDYTIVKDLQEGGIFKTSLKEWVCDAIETLKNKIADNSEVVVEREILVDLKKYSEKYFI